MLKSARQLVRSPLARSRVGPRRSLSVLNADTGKLGTRFFHLSGYTLVGLFPLAMVYDNAMIRMPCDIVLGILMPIHGHIGMNYIVSDYIPQAARGAARASLLGITAVTILGLLKLNTQGPGLIGSLKQMWKKPKSE